MTSITVTNIYTHKGGNLIFSGIVSEGQVMDNGWTKLDSGEISEIRMINNMKQRVPAAGPDKEYLFMCSHVFKKVDDGDELMIR
jgi:hypothetical protein